MNNKAGGQKARTTNITKYGSEAAYRRAMSDLAKKPRAKGRLTGFAAMKASGQVAKLKAISQQAHEAKRVKKQEALDDQVVSSSQATQET